MLESTSRADNALKITSPPIVSTSASSPALTSVPTSLSDRLIAKAPDRVPPTAMEILTAADSVSAEIELVSLAVSVMSPAATTD